VFVNREGEPVTQDGLLKLLEAEPQRKSKGGSDRNVKGERLPVLDEFIPPTDWARRCQQARNAAASALREHGDLQARSEAAQEQVAADAEAARRRIRARAGAAETAEQDIERQDRLHDALRAGVQNPTVRLDSVGVVILSGDPLPVEEEEE
jgi:ATP-dependent helicase HepA